jgi:hypothetical protein
MILVLNMLIANKFLVLNHLCWMGAEYLKAQTKRMVKRGGIAKDSKVTFYRLYVAHGCFFMSSTTSDLNKGHLFLIMIQMFSGRTLS